MAQTRVLVHSMNNGEVSPATLARVDQERAQLWAETQENLLPFTIGKSMMRPGTTYLGASSSNNLARGVEFVKGLASVAGLELTAAKLRVWVDDALVTRASVTSTVTNGDFSSSVGWTLTTSGGAVANINSTVSGALWMACPYRGGMASCVRSVTTTSTNTQHALRIVVTRGPVSFRCGSSSGGDELIEETTLDTGEHSLAFTPAASPYYVYFSSRREPGVIVNSITVESAGVMSIDAPWAEDELFAIQYDQSGDIVFLAHTNWQPRKIERRGDASWSLVKYEFIDGPFTATRTAPVRLAIGASRGNTTLFCDGDFFKTSHVGALFHLTHDRMDATFGLGTSETYTNPWRVTGVNSSDYNDRAFGVVISGTWVGTLRTQRSVDGDDAGFRDFPREASTNTVDITANASYSNSDVDDNLIAWYRMGFGSGLYTSGAADIRVIYNGHGGSGVCRVTDYTGGTQVDVEVLDDFVHGYFTDSWLEGEFSDRRGWPSAVSFHDGRLIWQREDKFRASESDDFTAFNLDTEGDAGSIQRDVATSGAVFNTNWLLSLSRLIIGTDGAEVPARSDAFDTPLTPTNIAFKNASTVGSGPYSPERLDKQGFFIARSNTRMFKLRYNFEQQDYDSEDATELHEDLGEDHDGFTEIAAQRHPQPYLWVTMGDGQCALLLHSPKHEISSWVRVVTDGEIESVYVLPGTTEDSVYLWVKRTINGSTVRYHEKVCLRSEALGAATTKLADAGSFTAGPTSTITATHLAGETGLVAWGTSTGSIYGPIGTLASDGLSGSLSCSTAGSIALGASYSNVFVGLPYAGRYKSAKLAYGAEGGTALMQDKIIPQVGLLMSDVHKNAIMTGPDFDRLESFAIRSDSGAILASSASVKESHDAKLQPAGGSWSPDSRVCLQVNAGHPATLNALAISIRTQEK